MTDEVFYDQVVMKNGEVDLDVLNDKKSEKSDQMDEAKHRV